MRAIELPSAEMSGFSAAEPHGFCQQHKYLSSLSVPSQVPRCFEEEAPGQQRA